MDRDRIDVIVVGGGVMGCAAAWQLAKDGQRVLLLEKYSIGNHHGSSHGASRLFRLAHESIDYVELARTSYKMWQDLENESGKRLLHPVDALDLGSPDAMDGLRLTLQAAGVPFEPLDRDTIMQRFPHFILPDDTVGLYQDSYAMLPADRCVSALALLARQYGTTILECHAVRQVLPVGAGVQVRTDKATFNSGKVVLCAGSWMKLMMTQLGVDIPLTIRKEHITFYKPKDPSIWMPGRFPIFRHHLGGTNGRWGVGFPIFEHAGVKLLIDCTGPLIEPGDTDRSPDEGVVNLVRKYAARLLPTLGDDIIEVQTCLYTMTPDDDFILDLHPGYPQIVIASPCSGHGFKFAPLIGRILADLAVNGNSDYNIERFCLDRAGLKI